VSDWKPRAEALARKYALENAVKHGGKATPGAVIGKVLAEDPALRAHAKEVPAVAAAVVADVNAMDAAAQKAAFDATAHERVDLARKKEDTGPLPALPDAAAGKVVLRFAPNPSGPLTLGHARGVIVSFAYGEKYDGTVILRFDDTDATVKRPMPEAYAWIPEDIAWLAGRAADRTFRASARIPLYYEWAAKLVDVGGAYVCECTGDDFRVLKERGEPCPHRGQDVATNAAKWKRMTDGGYKPGEAVLRVKTDIRHRDPALRDWVAFRLARDPHPLEGDTYPVWPLLDFQSAIDDHVEGVTHIIRGKDLRDSTEKQAFLYRHLGWTYPHTLYWGRASVHEFGKFSKSILSEGIKSGEYSGWDDPRLPTLRALRRRGFAAEAIRAFWLAFGLSEKDVAASMKTLESENRKVVEPTAHRFFFVDDPREIRVTGAPALAGEAPRHPDRPQDGMRRFSIAAAPDGARVLLAGTDHDEVAKPGRKVRLKDLANLRFVADGVAEHAGNDLAFLKEADRIVHWAPVDGVPVEVLMDDGSTKRGLAERGLADEKAGAIVQFERFGFVRLEAVSSAGVKAVFTHK